MGDLPTSIYTTVDIAFGVIGTCKRVYHFKVETLQRRLTFYLYKPKDQFSWRCLASFGSEIRTALHWACKRNHVAVVKYLLDRGADKNVKNNDGHIPAQLTSNEGVRQLLGVTSDCEVKTTSLPILPNYLASPAFPYMSNDRDNQTHFPANNMYYKASGGDGRAVYTPSVASGIPDELVLKARLANSDEKDFIEIELPHTQLNFAGLFNLMCAELGVDKSLVAKIRKLPDTIIRKDKDVKRLTDFQELELVLTNKAASASSRTYCLAPARNNETILY